MRAGFDACRHRNRAAYGDILMQINGYAALDPLGIPGNTRGK